MQIWRYLREQLVHSFLNQRIKIIHGVTGAMDKGVIACPTLQIHNSVLDMSGADAQMDAKCDGRHWT